MLFEIEVDAGWARGGNVNAGARFSCRTRRGVLFSLAARTLCIFSEQRFGCNLLLTFIVVCVFTSINRTILLIASPRNRNTTSAIPGLQFCGFTPS